MVLVAMNKDGYRSHRTVTCISATNLFLELKTRIDACQARVGVIGLGYVGLPLALLYTDAKFRVTGFDNRPA